MPHATNTDVIRMRNQLFFEGDDKRQRLSRFWLLLVLAAVIASAGVVSDSTATVIGAMIVAPLMTPILGTVVALVLADRANVLRCLALVVTGAIAVILVAWLVGLVVEVPVTASTSSQVASRITPRLIDLVAALATGAVGSVALARDDISDTLPGVAIAISLVPPLAVVGLTLEAGATDQALGALLLFVTNVSAILAMGLLVMSLYRVSSQVATVFDGRGRVVNRRRATAVIVAGLAVISVPLGLTSSRIATTQLTESNVEDVAGTWAAQNGWQIDSVTTRASRTRIRASGSLPEPDTAALKQDLSAAGVNVADVTIELTPSRSVDLGSGS